LGFFTASAGIPLDAPFRLSTRPLALRKIELGNLFYRRFAMIATHNDLQGLIEFSIENNAESAIVWFPMFSAEQIRRLYDISISQRRHLLREWGVEDPAMDHFLHHFHSHQNPAQAEKIRQQETDATNK
jgi:hypothetical protein